MGVQRVFKNSSLNMLEAEARHKKIGVGQMKTLSPWNGDCNILMRLTLEGLPRILMGNTVNENEHNYLYRNYVERLARQFESEYSSIESIHNFELGAEFEVVMCKVLRQLLPDRYGICRGYIVNAEGDVAGDDIIIFDRINFPTLLGRSDDAFDRKEHVPAEAVYGYIEAKYTLDFDTTKETNFNKSLQQIADVRQLCSGRNRHYMALQRDKSRKLPKLYCAVVSRRVSLAGNRSADPVETIKAIPKIELPGPDFLVAGPQIATRMSRLINPQQPNSFAITNDMHHESSASSYLVPVPVPGTGFGIFVMSLMGAISETELLNMPWHTLISDATNKNGHLRYNQEQSSSK